MMNDFTKEELNKIYNFIQHHKQDSYDDMRLKGIENKIQSMLDKYCEHEFDSESQVIVSVEYFNQNQGYETHKERKAMCSQCKKWVVLE